MVAILMTHTLGLLALLPGMGIGCISSRSMDLVRRLKGDLERFSSEHTQTSDLTHKKNKPIKSEVNHEEGTRNNFICRRMKQNNFKFFPPK